MNFKINKKEREEMREYFPEGFAKLISSRLKEAGLRPQRAKEYNPKIVKDVFAGLQNDFNVVLEIFRYKDEILAKRAELERLRNKEFSNSVGKEPAQKQ